MVNNGMRTLTLNGTVESWPRCLACALTDRSFAYTADNRTDECQACFNTWCWNGQDDDSEPPTYEPTVGTVPQWLTDNNLASQSSGSDAPAQTSDASEASETPNSGVKVGSMTGGMVGVVVAVTGVLGGALSISL